MKISQSLHYPKIALENGIQGRVIVKLIIDKLGNVKDAIIIRGLGGGCDQEAIRITKNLKFLPGKINGISVISYIILPIRFKLS